MFIVVGGASRSGTGSVSTFLHLHDEIMMCRTMARIKEDSTENMSEQCRKVVYGGKDILQIVLFENRQSATDKWSIYVNDKNRRLLNGHSTKHVGVRWDYAEFSDSVFGISTNKGQAKFVLSMRNLKDLFTSLSFNRFLGGGTFEDRMKDFQRKTTRSIDSVMKMKKRVCPVEASNSEDLYRLMDWLRLDMSDLQKSWADSAPVTNDTRNPEYAAYKKEIADKIKIPVGMEQRYWAILDEARTVYRRKRGEENV
jgi:hypothetical protein